MENLKLLGLGTPVLDLFAQVDTAFLKKWELRSGSTNFISDTRLDLIRHALGKKLMLEQPGDNARNLCDGFARLEKLQGWETPVGYAGSVGVDAAGEQIYSSLMHAGVQSFLTTQKGPTGEIACLITPDKQRTFAARLGIGEEFPLDVELPSSDLFFVTSISALCSGSMAKAVEKHVERCAKEGIQLMVSLESPAMLKSKQKAALALAKKADVLFLNADEMEALALDEKQAADLAPLVFLKKGAKGSAVFEGGKKMGEVGVAPVKKVVDTTGAGDTYAAGVLSGLTHGKTPLQAAKLGAQAAAAAIGHFGGGLPDGFVLA